MEFGLGSSFDLAPELGLPYDPFGEYIDDTNGNNRGLLDHHEDLFDSDDWPQLLGDSLQSDQAWSTHTMQPSEITDNSALQTTQLVSRPYDQEILSTHQQDRSSIAFADLSGDVFPSQHKVVCRH
jgi:hypothetical protein